MLEGKDCDDLASLRYHWDGAYRFTVSAGTWIATSTSCPAGALTASSARELRRKVRDDYMARLPVPRTPVTGYLQERMST